MRGRHGNFPVESFVKTLVIIPTYNEAENLPRLAEAVLAASPELELLVVDDNSPDGTGQLADAIAAIHRRFPLGPGTRL